MTSRRTAISCRRCGAPGRLYLGGRLCPRHAPGGPDGEVMRAFPDYTGRIPQVGARGDEQENAGHGTITMPPERRAAPGVASTEGLANTTDRGQ